MTPEWLQDYTERGLRYIFYAAKTKHPAGPEANGWPQINYRAEDYREGDNVGIVLGTEIKPGRYLIDVDLDWAEGLTLAKRLLPSTGFGFGRASNSLSHVFYTVSHPVPLMNYDDINGERLVELRGTKKDGTIGLQTMAPPSIHPEGEEVVFRFQGEILHSDDVPRRVLLYAIACIFYRHLGPHGLLHDLRLALSGFLLQLGFPEKEVEDIGVAICMATGNDVKDFRLALHSAIARYKSGQPILGKGALLAKLGDDGKKVLARIRTWVGDKDFLYDAKGEKILANHQENIRQACEKLDVTIQFDQFAQKPIIHYDTYKGQLQDHIVNRLRFAIDTQYHFLPMKEMFFDVLLDVAFQNKFHPVREYLDSLTWDGVPRIDRWLQTYGKAKDTEFVRTVGALVLVAAVRRVRQPGCKFDEMLVLISGKQGTEKSSAIRALCPNADWFSDDVPLNVDAKQIIERTGGKWFIEAAELQGFSIKEEGHLRALLSRQTDGPVRLAYERLPTEVSRQFIFIGTTNTHRFLKDKTGNRRFWPVEVEKFDLDQLKLDRDQLWAEAVQREATGCSIRLDSSLWGVAEAEQEERRVDDPWEEIIHDLIAGLVDDRLVPSTDIWTVLGTQASMRDSRHSTRITAIMQRHGYKEKIKCRPFKGADPIWCWIKGETQVDMLENQVEKG